MKDLFSRNPASYSRYRPRYPAALFDFIVSFAKQRHLAWDCATGNGQAAVALSPYFEKVVATDISSSQLSHAEKSPNVVYLEEPADRSSLPSRSVNLVTVAQALHWLDTDKFYSEVRRVAAPGGLIAVWVYGLLRVHPRVDHLIDVFHFETLGPYWDEARRHVDDGYANLNFPFATIKSPAFEIKVNWNISELEGYLNTWSGLQHYMSINKHNPVPLLMDQIDTLLQHPATLEVRFPLTLKMGLVN